MIKPANRTTLYEEVTKQIISMIKEGKWLPGDKIPGEIALSKAFEVSRNCIREALKSLELSGIVEAKPGRGTFLSMDALKNVNRMELLWILKNDSSIVELYETRLIIEPQLGYLAAKRANEDDIDKLEKIIQESRKHIENKSYTTEMGFQFHMAIADISRNEILSKFLNSITDELNAQRLIKINKYLDDKEVLKEIEDHNTILEYIRNREAEKTQEFLYQHIYESLKSIKDEN